MMSDISIISYSLGKEVLLPGHKNILTHEQVGMAIAYHHDISHWALIH
tara:strand:- start:1328 stop:1471 length:144 start_codon:yes stop_codon:yes gene_type:complete